MAGPADIPLGRGQVLAQLDRAGRLVESRVRPDGDFGGWSGRDVLCHLGAYARVIAAMLQAEAEGRQPTETEMFGRDLTDAERAMTDLDEINEAIRRQSASLSYDAALALWRAAHAAVIAQTSRLTEEQLLAPGPTYAPAWSRPRLFEVVTALIQHYQGHISG